jgi:hypothetical protein
VSVRASDKVSYSYSWRLGRGIWRRRRALAGGGGRPEAGAAQNGDVVALPHPQGRGRAEVGGRARSESQTTPAWGEARPGARAGARVAVPPPYARARDNSDRSGRRGGPGGLFRDLAPVWRETLAILRSSDAGARGRGHVSGAQRMPPGEQCGWGRPAALRRGASAETPGVGRG